MRSVVHDVAGTTVDPVDSLVELDGEVWRFVDTAGLRKRVQTASGMEYYASLRTRAAIEAAEVAVVLIDASEPIAEQDQRVITMVEEAGRALVLAFNKWDLVDEDRRLAMKRELERDLRPRAVGRAGQHLGADRPGRRARSRRRCAPRSSPGTSGSRPAGSTAGSPTSSPRPRRRCAAASSRRSSSRRRPQTRPPTFVLFTTGFLEAGYRRFLERRLREEFGFAGSPVRISVRVREKRNRKG